jgi:hypothetical protein
VIEATVSGRLQGAATERGNGRVTARLYVATRCGLGLDVIVTAHGGEAAALLRFQDGDAVEASGAIEPRVRMDERDNPLFVFDLEAWAVKRIRRVDAA